MNKKLFNIINLIKKIISKIYNYFFELKRGNIIIRPNYSSKSDGMFMLLNDINKKSIWIDIV